MDTSRKTALTHQVKVLKNVALGGIERRVARAKAKGSHHAAWACRLTELSKIQAYSEGLNEVISELRSKGLTVSLEKSFFNQKETEYLHLSWGE